ncbi:50S ribosomal protein L17 [Candidatus Peregrinibacteria bacterium]|nr:50S ribosomal protein L17 [Candidatus Peregrinibacteria bacterium]
MRHKCSRLRLKQKPDHAKMLERNLITSLLLYESIRTTRKRAKVIQPAIDKLISYSKSHDPQIAIRYVNKVVTDKNACRKIMDVYITRYKDRSSGLSRIIPVGVRKGDGAQVVDITLIDADLGVKPKTEEPKKKEKKQAKPKAEKSSAASKDSEKPEAKKKTPAKKKTTSTTKKA